MEEVFILLAVVALYLAPYLIAKGRKSPNVQSVLVVNLFLGWTLIGWVVALAMAYRDPGVTTPVLSGSLRRCPYCAEDIQRAAVVCKHCGRDVQKEDEPPKPPKDDEPPRFEWFTKGDL